MKDLEILKNYNFLYKYDGLIKYYKEDFRMPIE